MLVDVVIILVVIQAFMVSYNFFYKVFTDTCVNSSDFTEIQFVIPPDSSTTEIVDALVEDGLVNDKYVMLAKVYLSSYHGKMMPGTYFLSKSMTQTEILKVITATADDDEE
jgi:cell division protein YceG involved in septum cleavage